MRMRFFLDNIGSIKSCAWKHKRHSMREAVTVESIESPKAA